MRSQEVEWIVDLGISHGFLYGLSCQLRQLVGALQTCWNLDRTLPIVVIIALLVRKPDEIFLRNLGAIIGHNIVRRSTGPLSHLLSHQMEVEAIVCWQLFDDDTAGLGVEDLVLIRAEETRVYAFVHEDIDYLGVVVWLLCFFAHVLNGILQEKYLVFQDWLDQGST